MENIIKILQYFLLPLTFVLLFAVFSSNAIAGSVHSMNALSDTEFQDSSGRKITIAKPFTRIISLYPAHSENLFELGLNSEIVGVSKNADFPEKVKDIARFSYRFDAEKFIKVKPDLILIRPMVDHAYPRLINQLERLGIVVVSLQPSDVRQMKLYWHILGMLTGKQEQAKQMISVFQNQATAWHQWAGKIEHKKRVYFEAIHGRMKTFTPQAMAIFVLENAGGSNVAADAKSVLGTNIAFYGKEQILSKARQIDVYLAQAGVMNRPTLEIIKNEPGYSIIKAVKNNKIYIVDEAIVSRPTMRLLLGIRKIAGILYPKRIATFPKILKTL